MAKYKNFEIRKGNLLEFTYHNSENDLTDSSYDKDIWVIESENHYLLHLTFHPQCHLHIL